MNKATWDRCTDPDAMLEVLKGKGKGKWSERKLRLFGCACCRACPRLNVGVRRFEALDVAERFADGLCGPDEIERIYNRDFDAIPGRWKLEQFCLAKALANTCYSRADAAAECVLIWLTDVNGSHLCPPEAQCTLLREMAGNPFARGRSAPARPAARKNGQPSRHAAVDRAWLHWDGGTIVRLARAIYDERRFEDLPVLADALEEAGCTNADILTHCRRPDGHVLGCWALDQLLDQT